MQFISNNSQCQYNEQIILGVDPGLAHTGWAIILKNKKHLTYVDSGTIHTALSTNNDQKKTQSFAIRLVAIFDNLDKIIKQHKPNTAAIENTYVNINYSSSLKLSQARAAAILACATNDLEITEYQAKTVKKTLIGKGTADKMQITKMINLYLKNIATIKSYDEADAIAIAICHAQYN